MDINDIDLSDLKRVWDKIEKEYKEKYIDKPKDHNISYIELCTYIDYLLNSGCGKKKSLKLIKKKFGD